MIQDESKHVVILQKQGHSFVINIAVFNALIITILLSQITQCSYSMKNDFNRYKLKNSASWSDLLQLNNNSRNALFMRTMHYKNKPE